MSNTVVAVFAYRRSLHLARVLRSLQVQWREIPLPIHLFLDGSRGECDSAAVDACRNVAAQFTDSLDLNVRASTANIGLFGSITKGISELLDLYSEVIVIEDDILTSPYFLRYMLDGLTRYADQPRVASIHGYTPPIPARLPETFFLRGADCWGWATWRDRWSLFRSDAAVMAAEIRDRGLANKFNLGGGVPNLQLLDARAAGRSGSWAICWHASCFLADRFSLHPGRSLVRNIGIDSSGEHCSPTPELVAHLTDRPIPIQRIPVQETQWITTLYAKQLARLPLHLRLPRRFQPIRKKMRVYLGRSFRRVWPSRLPMLGEFESYKAALNRSSGYDTTEICTKVERAVRSVLEGRAGYERDGTAMEERPPSIIIFDLLRDHLQESDTVVDVGGGLGGLYVNAPELFPRKFRYLVLEQQAMAATGRRLAAAYRLPIEFLVADKDVLPDVDILILSGVLQYLPNPWDTLADLIRSCKPRIVLIDRTAVRRGTSRWSLQTNPGYYSRAVTYPIQILNCNRLKSSFPGYRLEREWHNSFDAQRPEHIGMLFIRNEGSL